MLWLLRKNVCCRVVLETHSSRSDLLGQRGPHGMASISAEDVAELLGERAELEGTAAENQGIELRCALTDLCLSHAVSVAHALYGDFRIQLSAEAYWRVGS